MFSSPTRRIIAARSPSFSSYWLAPLLSAFCASSILAAELKPLNLGSVTEEHLWIPMRDGARLSAYFYFPKSEGKWPGLFQQRYGDVSGNAARLAAAKLAEAGYVVANVNFRGAQQSEGTWVGYRALGWGELKDGYDICEWIAEHPRCNGKIGTFGGSQAGYAQNFLAITRPPHLVAQYMTDTGLSLFHEGYRIGGATKPERFKRMDEMCRVPEHNRNLLAEWFQHPTYDEYWAQENCALHFDKMNVPCFTVGSWYDFMCVGSIESFIGRQHKAGPYSRGRQQLLIGPWLHGGAPKPNRIGDLTYPNNAAFDTHAHMLKWFDHHLKNVDNGVDRDPAVRYYVMGAVGETGAPGNLWREAKDWPVASRKTAYHFHTDGKLSTETPKAKDSGSTLLADPLKPASLPYASFPGARDARDFEKQPNVLTFTTDTFSEPVEWTGKVTAELFVSSTARDTDFIVRVTDVYPDGRSILIIDMVRRARYRDGFEKEVFLEPGKVHKVEFYVGWLSQIFNTGHRIRVTVASTGAPFYEPNPNTGETLGLEFSKSSVVATNTVHHNRRYTSKIWAPIHKE